MFTALEWRILEFHCNDFPGHKVMLIRELITVNPENHTKRIITACRLVVESHTAKADRMYSRNFALERIKRTS